MEVPTLSRPSTTAVFASNVRAAMARHDPVLDRKTLAEKMGRDRGSVAKRITGHTAVTLADVDAFADALDTTAEALLSWGGAS
jgi:hypothetical protein